MPENRKEFIEKCRKKLFEYREKRAHPHKGDKVLTAWNGLMIAAMAIGTRVLGEEKYLKAAKKSDYKPIGGKASAYVCENFACQAPATDKAALINLLL